MTVWGWLLRHSHPPSPPPHPPPTMPAEQPRTNVDAVLVEITQALTTEHRIRLTSGGCTAIAVVYRDSLGHFLNRLGKRHPEDDLWNDKSFLFLKEFVYEVVAAIARRIEKAAENPVGARTVTAAANAVMENPEVEARCTEVLKKLAEILGQRIAMRICGATD